MVGAYVTPSYEHDEPTGRAHRHGGGRDGTRTRHRPRGWSPRPKTGCARAAPHVMMLTSHNRRDGAHAFYRRLGYAETGKRFVREL